MLYLYFSKRINMMEALIRQMLADSMEMEYGAALIERECALSESQNTATAP